MMQMADSNNVSYYEERYRRLKALWLQVFIRAARDFALWKEEKNVERRKLAEDAKRFIFDLSSGLVEICQIFDLDIEGLRERAKKLTREDVKKIEMLERSKKRPQELPEDPDQLLEE